MLKPTYLTLSLLTFAAYAQQNNPLVDTVPTPESPARTAPLQEKKLAPGDNVSPDALSKLLWLRGEAPASWQPGKVYLIECWATWCGPCIAAVPHINSLYENYRSQGLEVLGINVFEDGLDEVRLFLKDREKTMTYPVAYTGRGGAFETEWLKPSGTKSIPATFVVKDGRLLVKCHPTRLSKEVVEALLAGGEAQAKVVESLRQAALQAPLIQSDLKAFSEALKKSDVAEMEKIASAVAKKDPGYPTIPSMRIEIALLQQDWPRLGQLLKEIDKLPNRTSLLGTITRQIGDKPIPVSLWQEISLMLHQDISGKSKLSPEFLTLAEAHWRAGNREAAISAAREGLAFVEPKTRSMISANYFRTYISCLEKGYLPTASQMRDLLSNSKSQPGTKTE